MNKNIIDPPVAKNKLNDLVKLTKANASKGNKRDIKKDIFRIKKQFKL